MQPDYSEKVDDPIATALRHEQQELRKVIATNKARKRRLASVARDRLAYQEYLGLRECIDNNIVTAYTKLQSKDGPKASKKKKKVDGAGQNGGKGKDGNGAGAPLPNPAGLGLGPNSENRLVVNDGLAQLVDTRRRWVDLIGGVFDQKDKETPGRIWGLPQRSIYDGIEEDIKRDMEESTLEARVAASKRTSKKGKEKVKEEVL